MEEWTRTSSGVFWRTWMHFQAVSRSCYFPLTFTTTTPVPSTRSQARFLSPIGMLLTWRTVSPIGANGYARLGSQARRPCGEVRLSASRSHAALLRAAVRGTELFDKLASHRGVRDS